MASQVKKQSFTRIRKGSNYWNNIRQACQRKADLDAFLDNLGARIGSVAYGGARRAPRAAAAGHASLQQKPKGPFKGGETTAAERLCARCLVSCVFVF